MALPLWTRGSTQQRIQGIALTNEDTTNWLFADVLQANEPNYSIQRVLTGGRIVTYRNRTWNDRVGPSNMAMHSWTMNLLDVDETLYNLVSRTLMAPVPITAHTYVTEWEFFDGDGTNKEFYLARQALSSGYSQSASTGLGVQSGSSAVHFQVYNRGTGASWGTVVYGRTFTVNSRAGCAGDTAGVDVDGTTTSLVEGVDWVGAAAADDPTAAENLRVAIDALAGVTATRSGTVVTVIKDAATKTLSLTTTDAANLEMHPTGTEIALDIAGTYAWRNFSFATAPASTPQSIIRIEYAALYNVQPVMGGWDYSAAHDVVNSISMDGGLTLEELGEGN